VVREIWFIGTLVTHSSEMSSSESSRDIHHKRKHPLNPTKLYVSGWVESSRSVLNESHNTFGWLYEYGMMNIYFNCMMNMLLALAYPFCCVVVMYVAVLSCYDHRLGWWELMGEVLMVNKQMVIPLLSHLGWSFLCVLFRAMAHVSLSVFLRYTLCCIRIQLSFGIVVCPCFVGVGLKTPGLRYCTYIVWRFPLISLNN